MEYNEKKKETIISTLSGLYPDLRFFPASLYEASTSLSEASGILLMVVSRSRKDYIAVFGSGQCFEDFDGDLLSADFKLCPLNHANRMMLNKYVPYTNPRAFGSRVATFGAGDRLGLAVPGLLQVISSSRAKPVIAQQSKRELDLTGRTLDDILDCAAFEVFKQGYQGGYGADGDHLKHKPDILSALTCGFTMITLDCSEKIGKGIDLLTDSEAEAAYGLLASDDQQRLELRYLSKPHSAGPVVLHYTRQDLIRNVLVYYNATKYMIEVYRDCLSGLTRDVDFEISIDETESTTTEYGHYFVASELREAGVVITSLAPRFIGEFQKGIDYMGDLSEFEKQLALHAAIADSFGYKLSIHSGSDKFSVFPLIGKYTKGRLHIKVSGTNWLCAIAAIAKCNPKLYREIHRCALSHFEESRVHYYVSTDLSRVPKLDSVSDDHLIDYLSEDNGRQLLHITYGFVLQDPALRKAIYAVLSENPDVYADILVEHIGRHLDPLDLR